MHKQQRQTSVTRFWFKVTFYFIVLFAQSASKFGHKFCRVFLF
jgi:hypothetical protein